MPDILIRDVPEEVANALTLKALEYGMDRQAWIRQKFVELVAQPTIKTRYAFKCVGPDAASATLRRFGDGESGGGSANLSQEQFAAYKKAALLVQRNALGDREAAHDLLSKQFEMVFEVPL